MNTIDRKELEQELESLKKRYHTIRRLDCHAKVYLMHRISKLEQQLSK